MKTRGKVAEQRRLEVLKTLNNSFYPEVTKKEIDYLYRAFPNAWQNDKAILIREGMIVNSIRRCYFSITKKGKEFIQEAVHNE